MEEITQIKEDRNKIYAIKYFDKLYKAHEVCENEWEFIALYNSFNSANGTYKTLLGLINSTDGVVSFDNDRDFYLWCFKNSRK